MASGYLSERASAAIRTLLYFDIFRYPLTAEEIAYAIPGEKPSLLEVRRTLSQLVKDGLIRQRDGFYFVGTDDSIVPRRQRGNALAELRLAKARQVSRFIGKFPFVRAVMVSGSLSKHYMEPDSDIDYFIVTKPGRLWIARTMLILYKKLFLRNSRKNFCVNYFVDTDHLEIEDKNAFTATECAWLLPTYNAQVYREFRAANAWADAWYPNFGPRDTGACHAENRSWIRRAGEFLLSGAPGRWLDTWCLRRTLKRWEKKFPHFDQRKFEVTLRSRKYVSKHHPADYQARVIGKLNEKIEAFNAEHGIVL